MFRSTPRCRAHKGLGIRVWSERKMSLWRHKEKSPERWVVIQSRPRARLIASNRNTTEGGLRGKVRFLMKQIRPGCAGSGPGPGPQVLPSGLCLSALLPSSCWLPSQAVALDGVGVGAGGHLRFQTHLLPAQQPQWGNKENLFPTVSEKVLRLSLIG